MINLRSLEDSVKFSYALVLDYSKELSRSAIAVSIFTVAVLAGLLTQFPVFGLAMVQINVAENLRNRFWANPATSEYLKGAIWDLIAFVLVVFVMVYFAEFWIIRTYSAPTVNFSLALDALLPWLEIQVLTPVDDAISIFSGEPLNINPKLIGILEGGIAPLFLLPVLGWIAVPYNPWWVINAMLISALATALVMYVMMGLGGINLFVEKRWRIASCVPDFLLSDTAIRSRRKSS